MGQSHPLVGRSSGHLDVPSSSSHHLGSVAIDGWCPRPWFCVGRVGAGRPASGVELLREPSTRRKIGLRTSLRIQQYVSDPPAPVLAVQPVSQAVGVRVRAGTAPTGERAATAAPPPRSRGATRGAFAGVLEKRGATPRKARRPPQKARRPPPRGRRRGAPAALRGALAALRGGSAALPPWAPRGTRGGL